MYYLRHLWVALSSDGIGIFYDDVMNRKNNTISLLLFKAHQALVFFSSSFFQDIAEEFPNRTSPGLAQNSFAPNLIGEKLSEETDVESWTATLLVDHTYLHKFLYTFVLGIGFEFENEETTTALLATRSECCCYVLTNTSCGDGIPTKSRRRERRRP